jgi:hypothetical protein
VSQPRSRRRRIAGGLARGFVYAVAFLVVVFGIALSALETPWGKDRLRQLIVLQANQYLTARLDIARLEGSLLRGLELGGIRLSRDGHTIISVDRVALSYSIRELFEQGTSIRRIILERPRVVAQRQPDGRWDVAALVKREARQQERTGPGRPIHILEIEVVDGDVELKSPLRFGAAHVPTRFQSLNTRLAFDYRPVNWRLTFDDMSWMGGAPDLTITHLSGGVASGSAGLSFDRLKVVTSRSAFVVEGSVGRHQSPAILALTVDAERFAFQEWSGILTGLKNIAVEGSFRAALHGPLARLQTTLNLQTDGGNARGPFVLDTTVPGWHGSGQVELERLNLARWLNRKDRPSEITGRVTFDLDLRLGRVPVGSYQFEGAHAAYMGYAGDNVRAKGRIEPDLVRIDDAAASAYGAQVQMTAGSIRLEAPYPFRFQGTAAGVDLRRLPDPVPVPHVESWLAFGYDVNGQFQSPFITGLATFGSSEFLGARIAEGATGSIDTSVRPIRYTGEGDVSALDIRQFGEGLDVGWMQDARYAGSLSGHFKVDGTGTDRETMRLVGGGRLARGEFFEGRLEDADVEVRIEQGSLRASYDGALAGVNPAVALGDPRFAGSLTGSGRAQFAVRHLLVEAPGLDDYDIDATLSLDGSRSRGVQIDRGQVVAHLADSTLQVAAMQLVGPALEIEGSGAIALDGTQSSQFDYTIGRANLAALHELLGRELPGELISTGQLTGPTSALRLVGEGTVTRFDMSGVSALTATADYDVTIPGRGGDRSAAPPLRVDVRARASFVEAFGQPLQQVDASVSFLGDRLGLELTVTQSEDVSGTIKGDFLVDSAQRAVELAALELAMHRAVWRLAPGTAPPRITWDDEGISVGATTFAGVDDTDQQIALSGTWRQDGAGALQVAATRVLLDSFTDERPARYGGVLNATATIRGTPRRPVVDAELTVSDGRIRRIGYQRLAGRVDYADQALRIDLRLDQAPGVWLTAAGIVPLDLLDARRSEQPMDLQIASSMVGLGLIEGLTTAVRGVVGSARVNVNVVGTSRDPHFTGVVELTDAAFLVAASGVRYQNGRAALRLASDVVRVDTFHLEDERGRTLDVTGSLGTHELRVGDLEIDVTTKGFEVMRNEFGSVEVDAQLELRGRAEFPRVFGTVTIAGGELNVDEILDRTLFRPYSTQAASAVIDGAPAPLDPWDRLGLDMIVRVPGTLRMTGEEVQITSGTPIGLGDINLRVFGEVYLYKDPGDVLYVTGSLDSLTGSYMFQGRRFDVDPASSVNFQGDLNPELYVTVTRLIAGVDTRVAIVGPLREPELRLASNPPLDPSDILSLIVFGTPANLLSDLQQRELAIRAGVLAAGFLTSPIVGALERTLGLEILEIEAPDDPSQTGPRVTIGDELLPGLVARFSRQFGRDEYDEATIEYYLSRIIRIRGSFSDAATLNARSPFRRTERAGIDLILFFSF